MVRSLLLFGLMGSLIAAGQATGGQAGGTGGAGGMSSGQTAGSAGGSGAGASNNGLSINSGYATAGASTQEPLLAPPNVALPGSGPATGAPPSMDVNNSRLGGTGDVVFPGAGEVSPALNGAPPEQPATAGTRGDRARNGILNTGMGRFASSADNASTSAAQSSQKSVADVAREYKARRGSAHPRVIDNSQIDSLRNNNSRNNSNASPQTLPQSDNATPISPPPPQAALNPRDLAIVEAELARARAASAAADTNDTIAANSDNGVVTAQDAANATAQPSTAPVDNSANAQATSQATAPTASQTRQHRSASANNAQADTNAQNQQQLPATASSLPLIGFIGLFAAGVGAIFAFRTRRA